MANKWVEALEENFDTEVAEIKSLLEQQPLSSERDGGSTTECSERNVRDPSATRYSHGSI